MSQILEERWSRDRRLKSDFEAWRARILAAAEIRYLLADGWYPRVRLGRGG
jgi:hypothetical protein